MELKEKVVDTYPNLPIVRNKTSKWLIPSIQWGNMDALKINRNGVKVEENIDKMVEYGFKACYSYWDEYKDDEDRLFFVFNPKEVILNRHFDVMRDYLKSLKYGNFNTFQDEFEIKLG